MEIKRCDKGHFYDAEANDFCPQCAAEQGFTAGGAENYGATEPISGSMANMRDYGPTEPVNGAGGFGNADIGKTQPLNGSSGFTKGNFAPDGFGYTEGFPGFGGVEEYDSVTIPVTPKGSAPGFMPVVGWLVCVEGSARGTDYRIRTGYNYIGRGEHMDICVKGDDTISRERHALIAYDQEERIFFFGPVDGKSIVRLNGKMVMNPQEIKLHDILTIGSTKLLFVPLCGEGFDWNEN